MKYKLTINYEYVYDAQEQYDYLIKDGYLPNEAKRRIEADLRELAADISCRADNIFWNNYTTDVEVEEIVSE